MKHLFFTIATGFALLAFAGCYGNDSSSQGATATTKSTKCGAGKCGDAKKSTTPAKCGTAKEAPKKAQCGTGKCGEGK
ncbi:MAG TPA: hypothetical protein ENK97_01220 [Campylobacteraceae bacterium]|nr:hypothetical protein [Campylobacteraceae bacterium]